MHTVTLGRPNLTPMAEADAGPSTPPVLQDSAVAGNVHVGWSQESVTGEIILTALNNGFVYEIDDSNKLVADDKGFLVRIDGSGYATSPVTGFYQVRSFYRWTFSGG